MHVISLIQTIGVYELNISKKFKCVHKAATITELYKLEK